MLRTIMLTISVIVAMIFFSMMLVRLSSHDEPLPMISELSQSAEADTIRITWKTDMETNGAVHVQQAGKAWTEWDEGFARIHTVVISRLSGDVYFTAESCTSDGLCASSEIFNGTFSLRQCADGTSWDDCSAIRPQRCQDGILADACRDCGCTAGLACVTNGSCINRSMQ